MFGRREGVMRIGQISKHTGLSVDAIRFYERNRLLAPPACNQGGFRLYSLIIFLCPEEGAEA
jgi:hypothetical protein